jgi:hypothetical protein
LLNSAAWISEHAVRFAVLLVLLIARPEGSSAIDTNRDGLNPEERVGQTPRTIRVGEQRPIDTIAAAARLARDGDSIEIDAGDYRGDTAVWTQTRLKIRGVGGRPRLMAAGQAAHRNGAGIRLARGKLAVRRCVFTDNETGMLVGNDPSIVVEIEDSEFGNNGAGDGQSHNLYVGTIDRLLVTGSYFYSARVGHLLKSRARETSFTTTGSLTSLVEKRATSSSFQPGAWQWSWEI